MQDFPPQTVTGSRRVHTEQRKAVRHCMQPGRARRRRRGQSLACQAAMAAAAWRPATSRAAAARARPPPAGSARRSRRAATPQWRSLPRRVRAQGLSRGRASSWLPSPPARSGRSAARAAAAMRPSAAPPRPTRPAAAAAWARCSSRRPAAAPSLAARCAWPRPRRWPPSRRARRWGRARRRASRSQRRRRRPRRRAPRALRARRRGRCRRRRRTRTRRPRARSSAAAGHGPPRPAARSPPARSRGWGRRQAGPRSRGLRALSGALRRALVTCAPRRAGLWSLGLARGGCRWPAMRTRARWRCCGSCRWLRPRPAATPAATAARPCLEARALCARRALLPLLPCSAASTAALVLLKRSACMQRTCLQWRAPLPSRACACGWGPLHRVCCEQRAPSALAPAWARRLHAQAAAGDLRHCMQAWLHVSLRRVSPHAPAQQPR